MADTVISAYEYYLLFNSHNNPRDIMFILQMQTLSQREKLRQRSKET